MDVWECIAEAEHDEEGKRRARPGCKRPARGVLVMIPPANPGGRPTYRPVRCGRSNSCEHCARLAAIENVLVVALDARNGSRPSHGVTLTTRDPLEAARFREATAQFFRWLRSEVGPLEYLGLVEWTTGNGQRSGGRRRMHQHTLVKGLPEASDPLWRACKRRWEALTGAYRVELRELRTVGGATAYIVGHHQKSSQAPPSGWSGKRFRPSKGYFDRPVGELRTEVRDAMRQVATERAVHQLLDQSGRDPADVWPEEWEQLIATVRPAGTRVVRVVRRGQGLVDAATGEVVDA